MTKEEKDKNRLKILFALAVLLGGLTDEQISEMSEFGDLPDSVQKNILVEYSKNKEKFEELAGSESTTQVEIQQTMAGISKARYWKILNPNNAKTCEKCRAWIGKVISDEDPYFPSTKDWIDAGALHPRCQCSLHEVKEMDEVDQKAKDYLARKQKRLKELIEYRLSTNSIQIPNPVFN